MKMEDGSQCIMNIETFAYMLVKNLESASAVTVEHLTADGDLLRIATSDNSQFIIKIGKCDTEQETFFQDMDETNSRIYGIFEGVTNSWEYNHVMMQNNMDLDWLAEKLEREDYQKLEDDILRFCLKNDKLVFRMGFRYAWSLFSECAGK